MSTISYLNVELQNLISETRRRNAEIKHAAERSIAILGGLSGTEEDRLKQLSQNSDFITPFLLSCSSRNAKFSSIAIPSIQKLIQARAVPISKIDILLDALIEATHLAVDIQLKVLQILPMFFMVYGEFFNGDLVVKLLQVCAMLQTPSKVTMVMNTASATEQQIVLSLFEKVCDEDKNPEVLKEVSVTIDEGQTLDISRNSYDVYRVFSDLCSLIEHQKPEFLPKNTVPESFGFELLEMVLTNFKDLFLSHVELGFLLRTRLTPLLLRTFANQRQFTIVVRVARIVLLLIKSQLSILEIEAEVILSLLTHAITSESSLPIWKKVLSLEIFSSILSDSALTMSIYKTYDFGEDKKEIITEFLAVCSEILSESWVKALLNSNEIVTIPLPSVALTVANSTPKVRFMEILDKNEAPQPPKAYTLFLILTCTNNLCEGVGKEALKLSTSGEGSFVFLKDETNNSKSVKELKSLIKNNARSLVTIGTEFLYSCFGNDVFHSLIRALQKLCHAAGFLGLSKERDSLLLMFSIATISNVVKNKRASVSETIAGTVTEAINAFSHPSQMKKMKLPQRYLNTRHVICFRALISLTVSLGPVLKESLRFILITFQWFDYFIKGPSPYLGLRDVPPKPDLAAVDLKLVENSLTKLDESTTAYEPRDYQDFVQMVVTLGKEAVLSDVVSTEPFIDDFVLCVYNRDFFLRKIDILSRLNATRYLQASSEDWKLLASFLSDIITTSKATPELRVIASSTFNSSILEIAKVGFDSNSVDSAALEKQLFQSFSEVVDKILETQNTDYISTADSDIIHGTLKTLHELLDRYGAKFTVSWEIIVHIIGSPFAYFEKTQNVQSQKQLLKSSFEILQLVMNDFLQSIPLKATKDVIDVLERFCSQTFDLNISFSAVSYYWLLSEYYRGSVVDSAETSFSVQSKEDLLKLIESGETKFVVVHCLWLYALGSLVSVAKDPRSEMKNGAIQTFFRIVDSHGSCLNWEKTFHVVLQGLLQTEVDISATDNEAVRTFIDSNIIVIKGVTDIYCRFLFQLRKSTYLGALLKYFNKYVLIEVPKLTDVTYKSFFQVCELSKNSEAVFNFPLLFEFWSSQPIKYVSTDLNLYQENLVQLMNCFTLISSIETLSRSEIEKTLSIFNNAIRFPFLPTYTSDFETPTKLQSAVLECLELLDSNDNDDLVLSQISSIILLPFQTRTRILKKLSNVNVKEVPCFIPASVEGLRFLRKKLYAVKDLSGLLEKKTVSKILRSLIEVFTYESEDSDHSSRIDASGLWKASFDLFLCLSNKVAPLLSHSESDYGVWHLVIDAYLTNLPYKNIHFDEKVSVEFHEGIKNVIIDHLDQDTLTADLVEKVISSTLKSSLLYENNELEAYLFDNCNSPSEITSALLKFSIEDYSTAPVEPLSEISFRLVCLTDLFSFCRFDRPEKLITIALPYMLCRLVMIIKRFSGSQKLLNHAPVASIQQKELETTLNSLHNLLKSLEGQNTTPYEPLLKIFPLILDNHQFIGRLSNCGDLLNRITAEFYKISNR
ncbi:Mon2p CYBJADRAFT_139660 [Cyberlindnera jadinii NRRL Y-1542]|uniref:MON2 protein n=1 Tax=Cyberlindnera jadinii (strain ATCC 18201 / CBS 1600 / BCRC 20928 / JCM 3617 / NBRC 0987 / NRRL Y-1542) TaxID=983966 RepID=A0A1E4S1D6_CYBJN|nr:hypothetical protein CYBJADRAFT_139660 [Cyberlindnera jadinii NRRL Y-1542]ODV73282.1 hypothetical protein CYBJADRAFT_139660 [Cyberlindnera jadinii NRRL Y-1542]